MRDRHGCRYYMHPSGGLRRECGPKPSKQERRRRKKIRARLAGERQRRAARAGVCPSGCDGTKEKPGMIGVLRCIDGWHPEAA